MKVGDKGEKVCEKSPGGQGLQSEMGVRRGDLFASMPPLEGKKALFAYAAGVRRVRRDPGRKEIKVLFVDVKKVHLNAPCVEEEWVE